MGRETPWFQKNARDGYELVLIPEATIWMGAGDDDSEAWHDEKPRHLRHIPAYYMGIYCVTVEQFRKFVEEAGYKGGQYPSRKDISDGGRWGEWQNDPKMHPVRFVNWHDAEAYANWSGLRLPTEPEWELAARGRIENYKYPWGNAWEEGHRVCWTRQKGLDGSTVPVDANPKGVSPFGMYQMSGNIWEWCADRYDRDAYTNFVNGNTSMAEIGRSRVLRGASWDYGNPWDFRSMNRKNLDSTARCANAGIRLARAL